MSEGSATGGGRTNREWNSATVALHVDFLTSKREKGIMPTNGLWKSGGFLFLRVPAILILLFHRVRALQVGTVPFTRNVQTLVLKILPIHCGPAAVH